MFNLSLDYQGFDALDQALGEMIVRVQDMRPLAEELREEMIADNRQRSMAGVDLNGVELDPLTTYTLMTRKGTGPPLAPEGENALIVSDYTVDINEISPFETVLRGYWPNAPWMRFHVTGYTHNWTGNFIAPRNPAGITPQGQDQVVGAFGRFVSWILDALAGTF